MYFSGDVTRRGSEAGGSFYGLGSNFPPTGSKREYKSGRAVTLDISLLDLLWIPGFVLLFALTVVVVRGVFDLAGFLGSAGWTAGVWRTTLLFPCSPI